MTGIRTASQTVIVVAMGLVCTAGAVALHQHTALPAPVAATAALAVYLLLLTLHVFAWRKGARAGAPLPATGRDRRETEVRRRKDEARPAPQPAVPPLPNLGARTARAQGAQPALPPLPPKGPDHGRNPFAAAPAEANAAAPLPPRLPEHRDAVPPPLPSAPLVPPVPPTAGPADLDQTQDYWSFRPAEAHAEPRANPAPPAAPRRDLPPFVTGRVSAHGTEPVLPEPALPAAHEPPPLPAGRPAATEHASSPRESDIEVIQDAIKRLIEDVNASEQAAGRPVHAGQSPDTAVNRSIDALRMTAGSMHEALAGAPAREAAAPQPPPLPPFVRQPQAKARPASPADVRARAMADAISAGRIDVALEPILGLDDQQTRHYEVSVRLRGTDGRPLELTAEGPDLRGTGMLPLFDGVRVSRTAAVARRLDARGKGGSVFSTFSGESVADEHFLGELAETLHQRGSFATQLVLSFTQSDVRAFSTPEWDSLADMRALGFRFAISHLTDLDMDFEALAEQGFAFVKLDASVFLSGLPAPSGRLPSSDVCRHLASHGLALVVERIGNEDQLARVFGFGVLLGQGPLFGGARPVRADVVNASRGATAAA